MKRAMLVIGAVVVMLLTAVTPAHAAEVRYASCSADGFKGTIKVTYSGNNHKARVYRIEVKVNDKGGDNGNAYWSDGGTAPTTTNGTGTLDQDGKYHTLREANYTTGYGARAFKFVFDKKWKSDPSCTGRFTFV